MKPTDLPLRKRTQISHANKTMFIWVAGASALISFALIASIFLGQKLFFNEKVLAEKNRTISTLNANNSAVSALGDNVRALDANDALLKARTSESDSALRVILDALPSDANSLAFGASLQNKLLVGIPGLSIESLQVEPVAGIESLSESTTVDAGGAVATDGANEITFGFSVIGTQDALRAVLNNLERSIRTVHVTSMRIENQGTLQQLTVQGRVFYEPTKNVVLYDKVVNP